MLVMCLVIIVLMCWLVLYFHYSCENTIPSCVTQGLQLLKEEKKKCNKLKPNAVEQVVILL